MWLYTSQPQVLSIELELIPLPMQTLQRRKRWRWKGEIYIRTGENIIRHLARWSSRAVDVFTLQICAHNHYKRVADISRGDVLNNMRLIFQLRYVLIF